MKNCLDKSHILYKIIEKNTVSIISFRVSSACYNFRFNHPYRVSFKMNKLSSTSLCMIWISNALLTFSLRCGSLRSPLSLTAVSCSGITRITCVRCLSLKDHCMRTPWQVAISNDHRFSYSRPRAMRLRTLQAIDPFPLTKEVSFSFFPAGDAAVVSVIDSFLPYFRPLPHPYLFHPK